jgi:hypothetical protein
VAIAAGAGDPEFGASVSWLGGSALVGYTDNLSGADDDLEFVHVDPFTCAACEGRTFLNSSFDDDDTLRIASTFSGGVFNSNGAFFVHRQRDVSPAPGTGLNIVLGAVFSAEDGDVTNFGGGCGGGGTLAATCVRAGNSAFAFDLSLASPSSAVFALFGAETMGRACGTCTLVPDVFQGSVGVAPATDLVGRSRYSLAIPPDPAIRGFGLYVQFAVQGSNCFGGFDLSNALFAGIN